MPKKCGRSDAIAAYVTQHPGCCRADLLSALSLDVHDAMPTYCAKIGLIFAAGPRGSTRYFPTTEQAKEADGAIRAQADQRRKTRIFEAHKKANLKRRARRHAAGVKAVNTRPGLCVQVVDGMVLSLDIKMTPARPTPGRWHSIVVPASVCSADARPWAHACADSIGGV